MLNGFVSDSGTCIKGISRFEIDCSSALSSFLYVEVKSSRNQLTPVLARWRKWCQQRDRNRNQFQNSAKGRVLNGGRGHHHRYCSDLSSRCHLQCCRYRRLYQSTQCLGASPPPPSPQRCGSGGGANAGAWTAQWINQAMFLKSFLIDFKLNFLSHLKFILVNT